MELIVAPLGAVTSLIGLPAEALPMALLRPLSGSGAFGLLASMLQDPTIGPDSYTGYLVSTFQGSTETTFYVLAVYFGAVQIRRIRHALAAGLTADLAGVAGAVFICSLLYAALHGARFHGERQWGERWDEAGRPPEGGRGVPCG